MSEVYNIWLHVIVFLNILNCLPFIYKMKQACKANESVSECSKTWLCITVNVLRMLSRGKT